MPLYRRNTGLFLRVTSMKLNPPSVMWTILIKGIHLVSCCLCNFLNIHESSPKVNLYFMAVHTVQWNASFISPLHWDVLLLRLSTSFLLLGQTIIEALPSHELLSHAVVTMSWPGCGLLMDHLHPFNHAERRWLSWCFGPTDLKPRATWSDIQAHCCYCILLYDALIALNPRLHHMI